MVIHLQRVMELEAQQSINSAAEMKLQTALKELDDLKAARERQMEVMRDYMSKRDSYSGNLYY
jgi:D-alanyl-D-alanine carboxypeptidase